MLAINRLLVVHDVFHANAPVFADLAVRDLTFLKQLDQKGPGDVEYVSRVKPVASVCSVSDRINVVS